MPRRESRQERIARAKVHGMSAAATTEPARVTSWWKRELAEVNLIVGPKEREAALADLHRRAGEGDGLCFVCDNRYHEFHRCPEVQLIRGAA